MVEVEEEAIQSMVRALILTSGMVCETPVRNQFYVKVIVGKRWNANVQKQKLLYFYFFLSEQKLL
jgi:hypothetical protein